MSTIGTLGVSILSGAQDWQIFQQSPTGTAAISLAGQWRTENPFTRVQVMVRLVLEDTGSAVRRTLEWRPADTQLDGRWSYTLIDVPRGGLYRIETGLQLDDGPVEWIQRGDMIHHLGVGDVWIIAGQSNAAGYGRNPTLDGPELGVHMFHARGQWALATHPLADSTSTRYPANREFANAAQSPFLHFARVLKHALGYPIGLIPTALGGSALDQWLPSKSGALFTNMLAYVRDSGGQCRGMVWYQGESDANETKGPTYLQRFTEFVAECRTALATPALPIITAQLNRWTASDPMTPGIHAGWDIVREAQRQAARTIPGVHVMATLDCGLSDLIHNGADANRVIAERMAAIVLGAVCGHDIKHRHPDLESARADGPRRVVLTFADVDLRLSFDNNIQAQIPFAVRDATGMVPLTSCRIEPPNRVVLELHRDAGPAAVVVGAPSACPPYQVPFDVSGYRPILAFTATIT
ncbi:MAG: sialate O-acetylesterase [Lentisphaerae bacterium]|nr:sialate O-acetylesterase [Lentisphaerota bacterium]